MSLIVIACESCGSRFRLDSEKLNKPRNKVRCSRCKHVFYVEPPEEDGLIHIEISEEEGSFVPGAAPQQVGKAVAPETGARSSMTRKVLFGGVAALLVLIITLYFTLSSSILTSGVKKTVPKEPAQPTVTIMESLQAYYLENIHAGQLLVIEGEVLNESPKPVSFVLVEGKLFNSNDVVAQIQRCYLGNVLSRKEIANLKLTEIQDRMMNREGKNLKNVRIPPASKVPFMLVFHNLPEISSLSNYSVDVISSQFD
ncbi:MAG: zinc-ribbon domain-containing protein [Desulfobacteraceae bacterium]|nr:zinc-ribbon domain-containing protein [Desulfobacteraceae bacterium]